MANRYPLEDVELGNNKTVKCVTTKFNGRKIFEFRGIKYGKPPVGDMRFKKSEAAESQDPLDFTVFPRPCPRLEPVPREVSVPLNVTDSDQNPKTVSPLEDCLYLNVFSGDVQGSNPVIVFLEGTTMRRRLFYTLRGDFLLMGAVVLVVVQFREGHLGFMTDLSENMPGNVALWDQILALKWVKENIQYYGGNPDEVTLAGSEMGAVCAHLLSQSEEAKDLFHKLILLNGVGTVPWGVDRDPAKSNELVSAAAQCEADKGKCLRGRSVASLDGAYRSVLLKNPGYKLRAISPIVQSDANYSGVTVKHDPLKCEPNQWGKSLPTMLGFTKHAGLFVVKDEPYVTFADPEIAAVAIKRYIAEFLDLTPGNSKIGQLFQKYFKPGQGGNLRFPKTGLVDFISTMGFKIPIQKAAECLASLDGTVYVFTLNYRSPLTKDGVDCGSEILYLFPSPSYQMTRSDWMISLRLVTLITNFVTYGDPTSRKGIPQQYFREYPRWLTYQTYSKAYYVIAERMGTTDKMENEFNISMVDRLAKAKLDSSVSLKCNLSLIVLLLLVETCLNGTCV